MFFATYLRRELRRRMRQAIFVALGLAVGLAAPSPAERRLGREARRMERPGLAVTRWAPTLRYRRGPQG